MTEPNPIPLPLSNEEEARFWDKTRRANNGCIEWTGATRPNGYGHLCLSRDGARSYHGAHRVAYALIFGPIPEGLDLDHLCRNPSCVNPGHLEPVTRRENLMRGDTLVAEKAKQTACERDHPLSGDNLVLIKDSKGRTHRRCRKCSNRRSRKHTDAEVFDDGDLKAIACPYCDEKVTSDSVKSVVGKFSNHVSRQCDEAPETIEMEAT